MKLLMDSGQLLAADTPYALRENFKSIPGARAAYDGDRFIGWSYPLSHEIARRIRAMVPLIELGDGVAEYLEEAETAWRAVHRTQGAQTEPIPGAKLKPWDHQARAFWFAHDRQHAALALDMGTGKSAVVAWLVAGLDLRRVLIACPLSVLGVWPKQFNLHAATACRVVPLVGSVAQKLAQAKNESSRDWGKPLVLVVNHESLWRKPFGEWVVSRSWDLVVADESHRAKAPGGKLSLFLNRLRPFAERRIALTGTLMPHSPLDVYAQLRFIDPGIFGTSFTAFRARYAMMGGYQGHQVIGYQRTEEFAAKLSRVAYQVRAEDVLDLPPVQHITREVTLSPRERRVYSELATQMLAEIEAGEVTAANALVKLLRLSQVTSGYVRTDDGIESQLGTTKRDLLADVLEDLPQREPVVVFCRFQHDLDAVRAVAEAQSRRYGELSGRDKGGLAADATMAPDVDVLGVQIQAGGVGVDLTRARYAVYYSVGYSLGDYLQSLKRVHRPGQDHPVIYYHLIVSHTVDAKIYVALESKRDIVEAVLERMKEEAAK